MQFSHQSEEIDMIIAIVSDIHGNIQALEAVLRDIDKQQVDKIINLGDIIGYGANPGECLELMMNDPRLLQTVQGNHENALVRYVLNQESIEPWVNKEAWQGLMYSRDIVGLKWILKFAQWPIIATLPEFGITIAHGSVASFHAWDYVDDLATAEKEFSSAPSKICFIGHTHCPFLIDDRDKMFHHYLGQPRKLSAERNYLINVGSVGQPRKGDYRPSYGLLRIDRGSKTFQLRQVNYDVDVAVEAILAAGLPEFLANRLRNGK